AAIAGELKKPEKTIPRGILISLGIATIIYCLVSYGLVGSLGTEMLEGDLRPIHTLAAHLGGKTLGLVTAVVVIIAMTSMVNSAILGCSRFPFAMSRDRLLPAAVGRINPRFLTPVTSILLSGALVTVAILAMD